ncbi:MAG: hypothetical protein ACTSYD_04015 [Candidatus Heimdallarchaeaceae archaeon]
MPPFTYEAVNVLINFARNAIRREKYKQAVEILERAYSIAEIEGMIPLQRDIEHILEATLKTYSTNKDVKQIFEKTDQEHLSITLKKIREPELYR